MAKNKNFVQFSGVVCERLRRLRDRGARFRNQREKQFKARDSADASLNDTTKGEDSKRNRLMADYGEAVRKINDLNGKIKDIDKAIDETIEYADQGELFDDPDTFTPPPENDDPTDTDDATENGTGSDE